MALVQTNCRNEVKQHGILFNLVFSRRHIAQDGSGGKSPGIRGFSDDTSSAKISEG